VRSVEEFGGFAGECCLAGADCSND